MILSCIKDSHLQHSLHCTGITNHVLALLTRQIAGINIQTPTGWIAWLAGAHLYLPNSLWVKLMIIPHGLKKFAQFNNSKLY